MKVTFHPSAAVAIATAIALVGCARSYEHDRPGAPMAEQRDELLPHLRPVSVDLTQDSPPESCEGKTCGMQCLLCPPDDVDCVETAEVKVCNDKGQCVPSEAGVCATAMADSDPCSGLPCGAPCVSCRPGDPTCEPISMQHECNALGVCSDEPPMCMNPVH